MSETTAIEATSLFRSLAANFPGIEIWPEEEFDQGGWSYFWIISRSEGVVRNLAYVRRKANQLPRRTYDDAGEDLWVDTGWGRTGLPS